MGMNSADVINFWFREIRSEKWFDNDEAFDQLCRQKFQKILDQASKGELYSWRKTAEGRLAEIIVLDQFSRNIYRNSPRAFAQDLMALTLAQEMVELGLDKQVPEEWRPFIYMPYMHSESVVIHEEAMKLFEGHDDNMKFEELHFHILKRFGRYPHRNLVLGRSSTPEEIEFLKTPGSSF